MTRLSEIMNELRLAGRRYLEKKYRQIKWFYAWSGLKSPDLSQRLIIRTASKTSLDTRGVSTRSENPCKICNGKGFIYVQSYTGGEGDVMPEDCWECNDER